MSNRHIYKTLLSGLLIVVCLVFVVSQSSSVSHLVGVALEKTKDIASSTSTQIIGQQLGTPMVQDDKGNINVMIVGYGGEGHAGSHLTDSIIIASFDPYNYSVALISIPRDLIVNRSGYINKINSVFAYSYSRSKNLDSAAKDLSEKIKEITGLSVPYYALIDFQGFTQLIDKIGGLDVTIPYDLYDRAYPGPNASYIVFSIKSGPQHLDGNTALKYARSRHSTSDFSRSQRQQLIIKAIIDKLTQGGLNLTTIKALYTTYQESVVSNISLDELIGLLRYGNKTPPIVDFGLTYECTNANRKQMYAGCVLYPVVQEEFNGMAGMLPRGAALGNISNYKETKIFAEFVTSHQALYTSGFPLALHNASNPSFAKKFPYNTNIVSNLAILLKRYGIAVDSVDNTDPQNLSGTLVRVTGSGDATQFLNNLQLFFPIDHIQYNEATVDLSGNALDQRIDVYLGNDFVQLYGNKPFTTYLNDAQHPHYQLSGSKN